MVLNVQGVETTNEYHTVAQVIQIAFIAFRISRSCSINIPRLTTIDTQLLKGNELLF